MRIARPRSRDGPHIRCAQDVTHTCRSTRRQLVREQETRDWPSLGIRDVLFLTRPVADSGAACPLRRSIAGARYDILLSSSGRGGRVKRREFIAFACGAAAWP